jgi:hypothetical protein
MSDQSKSEPEKPSTSVAVTADNEAQVELAGKEVLTLLGRATELADGNGRYAVEIAQKMSDQLWAAQKRVAELQARVTELEAQVQLYPARIAELEAEVQRYRDKSERAELWLSKISGLSVGRDEASAAPFAPEMSAARFIQCSEVDHEPDYEALVYAPWRARQIRNELMDWPAP